MTFKAVAFLGSCKVTENSTPVHLLFSCSVVSDSLWPHGLKHTRLPCPSLFPGVCSNSCPLSRWCHPTISSSVIPISFCLQSFPASRSFPMIWLFSKGGQGIGVLASVCSVNIQCWFPLQLPSLILLSQGLSRVFSHIIVWRHQFFSTQPFFPALTSIHDYWKKTYLWLYSPLSAKKCFFFLIYCLGWSQLFFQGVVKSLSCVWLLVTIWTVAYRAPPSIEFSRQEYWSGLPFPSTGDLPDPGIKPMSPAWAEGFFTTEPPWKPSKEQAYFNFMSAVTVSSDFGVQENCLSLFPFFPHLFVMKGWDWVSWSLFLTIEF